MERWDLEFGLNTTEKFENWRGEAEWVFKFSLVKHYHRQRQKQRQERKSSASIRTNFWVCLFCNPSLYLSPKRWFRLNLLVLKQYFQLFLHAVQIKSLFWSSIFASYVSCFLILWKFKRAYFKKSFADGRGTIPGQRGGNSRWLLVVYIIEVASVMNRWGLGRAGSWFMTEG